MESSARSSAAASAASGAGRDEPRAGAASGVLSAGVFSALVALVPLTSVPYGSVEPWWGALFEVAVFLLAAVWALDGALSGRRPARGSSMLLPALGLAAFAFAQSLTLPGGGALSHDPYETRLAAVKILALTVYAAMLLRYADTERRLRVLVYAVAATALLSALFGVARQASQREPGFLLAYLTPGVGYAQFINRNHFAYLAEMGLGLVAGLVVGGGAGRGRRLAHVGLALPVWAALVLCGSRAGLLAMLCQAVFLGATFGLTREARGAAEAGRGGRTRPRVLSALVRGALLAAMVCALVVGAVWVGGDPLAERVASVRDEVGAAGSADPARGRRADIWQSTWEVFEESPLVGTGLGAYWIAVGGHHRGSGESVPYQAHNDYLELLASGGLVGAALVAAFVCLFVRRARARLRAGAPFARAAALGALAGLLGVAVHSLFDFGLHVTANAVTFAALAAAATAGVGGGSGSQKTSPKAD